MPHQTPKFFEAWKGEAAHLVLAISGKSLSAGRMQIVEQSRRICSLIDLITAIDGDNPIVQDWIRKEEERFVRVGRDYEI